MSVEPHAIKEPGRNGYPTIVPGTEWAACSVHEHKGPWLHTSVYHVGDDPLWNFLPETGEHGKDNKIINAIHRSEYRKQAVLSSSYGPHLSDPFEAASMAKLRTRIMDFAKDHPDWKSITSSCNKVGMVRLSGERDYILSPSKKPAAKSQDNVSPQENERINDG